MAYRTRLLSVKLAQPAVVPIVEDDHEQSSIQEVSLQLMEMSSSMGLAYPSAMSSQAGKGPTNIVDTPSFCFIPDPTSLCLVRSLIFYSMLSPGSDLTLFG
ncbi:hypothetical protein E4T56_gene16001 [Termitomyces sp. T112]|nr:hypothetical protein E4T56_gene16001 [Termitomyces sp. T112]